MAESEEVTQVTLLPALEFGKRHRQVLLTLEPSLSRLLDMEAGGVSWRKE